MRSNLPLLLLLSTVIACSGGGSSDSGSDVSGSDACSAIGFKIASGDQCTFNSSSLFGSPLVRLRILSTSGETSLCSGTALTPYKVLTAAHCFIDDTLSVAVDTVYGTISGTAIVTHPNFLFEVRSNGAFAFFNDVAVVTVATPLPVSSYPILAGRAPVQGEEALIAGFGVTSPDSDAGDLNAGNAIISSVTPNHVFIEFTGNQSHPCVGDSGGPILVNQLGGLAIAGVVSQSDPSVDLSQSCREGDITLYTNTQNPGILDFILQQAPKAGLR